MTENIVSLILKMFNEFNKLLMNKLNLDLTAQSWKSDISHHGQIHLGCNWSLYHVDRSWPMRMPSGLTQDLWDTQQLVGYR